MLNINIAAEPIFHIGPFVVTNSILTTWIVILLLLIFGFLVKSSLKKIPKGLQNIAEFLIESIYSLTESVAGEKAKKIFPLVFTIFIFILLSNWIGLLPGFGSIGIWEEHEGKKILVPLFRSASADLNTTLALAIISVFSIQYFGIRELGFFKYIKKFINFKSPIDFFVGVLEIISEFSKIISFAFRLFGNIFAGEVLLTIIAFLVPVLAAVPFLALEFFIGLVQALVFAMLTLVFVTIAMTTAHEEHT